MVLSTGVTQDVQYCTDIICSSDYRQALVDPFRMLLFTLRGQEWAAADPSRQRMYLSPTRGPLRVDVEFMNVQGESCWKLLLLLDEIKSLDYRE
jgi:hypothetical protein